MIGDEELDALFTTLGGQLDDAELHRRVAGFRRALRRLGEDPAEAARIDALATDPDEEPSVAALVTRSAARDPVAWDEIVERYAPLVWSICRRFHLSGQDTEDVAQNVWLLLVERLGQLRDPAALPGWLATTTHRECVRVVTAAQKSERARTKLDEAVQVVHNRAIDEQILTAERNTSLLAAFAELPPFYQQLLAMLIADPPYSYAQISEKLHIPVGSIGPQRARGLERLRQSDAFTAPPQGDEPSPASGEARHGPDGRDDE